MKNVMNRLNQDANRWIELTEKAIVADALLNFVASDQCGASLLFLGVTRRWTADRETDYLEYESYREMAVSQLHSLLDNAFQNWAIRKAAICHRLGRVEIQEASVAIAVSSPHRKDAFAAGQWLMDELKRDVPIWKREVYADHSVEWQANKPS